LSVCGGVALVESLLPAILWSACMAFKTLILGIGNTLLSDEGVGIHAVRCLSRYHLGLPGVELLDGGTLSFTLAGPIARADGLIVIDAARLDALPGTVRSFEGDALDSYLRGRHTSVHEVGLADLMDITRLTGDLPRHRCLIGVQPQSLTWGERPTPEVAVALPRVVGCVLGLVKRWAGAART
jgi:hydrogenase maturation protease